MPADFQRRSGCNEPTERPADQLRTQTNAQQGYASVRRLAHKFQLLRHPARWFIDIAWTSQENKAGDAIQIPRRVNAFIETDHLIGTAVYFQDCPEVAWRLADDVSKDLDRLHGDQRNEGKVPGMVKSSW